MPEHYTKNTLECTAWCAKCQRNTQHRVDGGRRGPCIDPFLGCSETAEPDNSREWKFTKTGGISDDEHVVTVVGHGKTCYVFVEDSSGKNAAALLWCE
jgi:hypothetical protein